MWRLGGGAPPPMSARLTPPPTSTAPAGQPPVTLAIEAGAPGPRAFLIPTTSTRGPALPGSEGVTNAVARRESRTGEGCPQAMQVATSRIGTATTRRAAVNGHVGNAVITTVFYRILRRRASDSVLLGESTSSVLGSPALWRARRD